MELLVLCTMGKHASTNIYWKMSVHRPSKPRSLPASPAISGSVRKYSTHRGYYFLWAPYLIYRYSTKFSKSLNL